MRSARLSALQRSQRDSGTLLLAAAVASPRPTCLPADAQQVRDRVFESGVLISASRIGAQVVTVQQVEPLRADCPLGARGREFVGCLVARGSSASSARCAWAGTRTRMTPSGREQQERGLEVGDGDLHVDNLFGIQSRYSGRTDVIDPQRHVAETTRRGPARAANTAARTGRMTPRPAHHSSSTMAVRSQPQLFGRSLCPALSSSTISAMRDARSSGRRLVPSIHFKNAFL
jgi:hypothetical protein